MAIEELKGQLAPAFAGLLGTITQERGGYLQASLEPAHLLPALTMLRDNWGFTMLSDLTALDYHGRSPRFELVYNLYAIPARARILLKVPVDEARPEVESAVPLFKSANWYEREVYDMFGIRFAGHPDLRRIFLYESFVGHPLRKDYPVTRRQPLIGPTDYIKAVGKDGGESLARNKGLVVQGDVR